MSAGGHAAIDAIDIAPDDLAALRGAGTSCAVLDVREPWEVGICSIPGSLTVPLGTLPANLDRLPQENPLVVVCHHGMRTMQAVMWLRSQGYANAINLRGGLDAWARQVDPTMATY